MSELLDQRLWIDRANDEIGDRGIRLSLHRMTGIRLVATHERPVEPCS